MASPTIPRFYRVWFTVVDPIGTAPGVFGSLFAPILVLGGCTPTPINPPPPETIALLYMSAGFFMSLWILQLVLLRGRPNDLFVWRTVQAATLSVDLFIIAGFLTALNMQGRLGWNAWRAEEWTNVLFTAWVAVVRISFLLGIGIGGRNEKFKRS